MTAARRAGFARAAGTAVLLACSLLRAGAAAADDGDLRALYETTREAGDARTNLTVGKTPFPEGSSRGVRVPHAVEAWLVSATGRPLGPCTGPGGAAVGRSGGAAFLMPEGETLPARVAQAAEAIHGWQGAFLGSSDARLAEVWPGDLAPAEVLALKLAVERGDDRLTLLHVVRNDLDDQDARATFYERLSAPAEALRAERRGAPAITLVNTDVDDTWIASLWDRGRYASGRAYPGYTELLAAQGDFVVVLTARPPAIAGGTRAAALARLGLTGAPHDRVNLSVAPGAAVELLDSVEMGLVKAEVMLLQARLFPEAALVFNGDSGQGDWIAALLVRRFAPEALAYATIHDVRPWSRAHKDSLRRALLESGRLERLAREHVGVYTDGDLDEDVDLRVDRLKAALRADVDRALDGPSGRLDGAFLLERDVHLFRNHAELALDLAGAGRIARDAALRVVATALPDLRFLGGDHPFGLDDGDAERLLVRLERLSRAPLPGGQLR